jgi:hypothetical protein
MTLLNVKQGEDASLGALDVESLVVSGNYFTVTADLTSATWNTAAAHEIAVVTGLVMVSILAQVTDTGDDTSGDTATIALGVEDATAAMIAATEVDDLLAGELWYDTTPTTTAEAVATALLRWIVNGSDIGYTIAAEAAIAGTIVFHIWWVPLSSDATVAAGAGGAL